jgi:chromosome segregation ATPase
MSASVWGPLGIVLASIITGLVTWSIAQRTSSDTRRTTSGRIDTSDAATLWEEAQKLRTEYREEVSALRTRQTDLERQLATAQSSLGDAKAKLGEAQYTISLLRSEVRELRALCGETGADVEAVKREMATARSLSDYIGGRRKQAAADKDEGTA